MAKLVVVAMLLAGCSRPIQTARLSTVDAESQKEAEARTRGAACSPYWSLAFPGIGQACNRQGAKALVVGALAASEITAGVVAAYQYPIPDGELKKGQKRFPNFSHPASAVAIGAATNVYMYSFSDALLTKQLAENKLFVPQDSAIDLLAAPFNTQILKKPEIWIFLGVSAALAITLGILERGSSGRPNLFGKSLSKGVGYPAFAALSGAQYTHVAIGEEVLFRGVFQSGLSRSFGETPGWLLGSGLFGAAHIGNASAFEGRERDRYFLISLPIITAVGTYMGWVYKRNGYSLASSVAMHFWYDVFLDAARVISNPKNNSFSATLRIPF